MEPHLLLDVEGSWIALCYFRHNID
jgi:hypothetical protein